MGFQLNQGNNE